MIHTLLYFKVELDMQYDDVRKSKYAFILVRFMHTCITNFYQYF